MIYFSFRAMAVSLTMMLGRLGGAIGPFIFPVFLTYGCLPALLFIAALNLGMYLYGNIVNLKNVNTTPNSYIFLNLFNKNKIFT